jgi:hypothetical protein
MNSHINARLEGIRLALEGVYVSNSTMSTATRGAERDQFIHQYLKVALPPSFRFGTGDATDQSGARSGQLDIVVENMFLPSLPIASDGASRLYPAEGIAACIEVKSDIAGQWRELRETAEKLHALKRTVSGFGMPGLSAGGGGGSLVVNGKQIDPLHIPFFGVGYRGWKDPSTIQSHLADGVVDAILIIGPTPIFVAGARLGGRACNGNGALWAFICFLHEAMSQLSSIKTNPLGYL